MLNIENMKNFKNGNSWSAYALAVLNCFYN